MQTIREIIKPLPEIVQQNYIDAVIKQYGTSEMLDESASYTALLLMSVQFNEELTPEFVIRCTINWPTSKLGGQYWADICVRLEMGLPLI